MKRRIVNEDLGKQFNDWDKFYENNRVFLPTEK